MTLESKYTETFNVPRLKKLYSLNIDQFISLFPDYSHTEFKDEKMKDDCVLDKYKKIKNLYNYFKKNKNTIITTYKFGHNVKSGRRYADNPSLQNLSNDIRGLLVDGIYNDYDMKNAQPTLLLYLCKKKKLVCNELEHYINNREECLNSFSKDCSCDRSVAKNYFIRCITCEYTVDKIEKKRKIKNDFFIRFDKEIKNIQKQFYNDIFKNRINDFPKKSNNKMGSFISYILSDLEDEVLHLVLNKLQDKDEDKNCVKIFDGFYFKKKIDIIKLDKITKKYGVKWDIKDLDLSLVNKLDEIEPKDKVNIIGSDHNDISNQLLNGCLKNIIVYCDNMMYFRYGYKYITNERAVDKFLFEFIANSCIYRINEKGKFVAVHKINSEIKNLKEFIINKSPTDNSFRDELWNNTKHKIYFNNGYFDFKLYKFIENDKERLTVCNVDRSYNPIRNKKVEKEIYDRILNPIFSIFDDDKHNDKEIRIQLRDNFLYCLSRMIGGFIEDKKWLTLEGLRNTGKGVLDAITKNAFGSDYIKGSNAGNFSVKNVNNTDEAKANSHLCRLEFCKLVFCQEIPVNSNLDGIKIKQFSSGGDTFEARTNYKDEVNFKIQCGLIMSCNDLPNIKPSDAKQTLSQYLLKTKFIDENEKEEFSNIHYCKKDNSLKDEFLLKKDILNEFINIIFHAKKVEYPKCLKENINNDDDNDDIKLFLNLFEITDNKKDIIFQEELMTIIRNHKIPFKISKCKSFLYGIGCNEYSNGKKRGVCKLKYIGV